MTSVLANPALITLLFAALIVVTAGIVTYIDGGRRAKLICRIFGHSDVTVIDRARLVGVGPAGAEVQAIETHHSCGRCGDPLPQRTLQ